MICTGTSVVRPASTPWTSWVALSEKSGIELAGKSIVRSSKPTAAPVAPLPPTCSSQRAMSGAALDTVTPASNGPVCSGTAAPVAATVSLAR